MDESLDLGAYLARIGVDTPVKPDMATLGVLHRAHVKTFAFENLDVQMGRPISLEIGALQEKMIRHRRGGYCFEQNTLFAHAVRLIGFECHICEARVRRYSGGSLRPRTHMVLKIVCAGRSWLADVGFGGEGITEPIAIDGSATDIAGRVFRIINQERLWVLQAELDGAWDDVYAMLPTPVFDLDIVVANWFTSTHPDSPFVKSLVVQRALPEARHTLRNLSYTINRGAETVTREIARAELAPLLRDVFELDVADDARFRGIDGI
jgi:N-hydroxyarylamine O-acetyltransferase